MKFNPHLHVIVAEGIVDKNNNYKKSKITFVKGFNLVVDNTIISKTFFIMHYFLIFLNYFINKTLRK